MDISEGMNLVYQQRSIKVPVPGVPYSSIKVSESISYLVSNNEYEELRVETGEMLTTALMEDLKSAIKKYEEVV